MWQHITISTTTLRLRSLYDISEIEKISAVSYLLTERFFPMIFSSSWWLNTADSVLEHRDGVNRLPEVPKPEEGSPSMMVQADLKMKQM